MSARPSKQLVRELVDALGNMIDCWRLNCTGQEDLNRAFDALDHAEAIGIKWEPSKGMFEP